MNLIATWIKNSFFANKDHWILWAPVFFGLGIIFYFYFPQNNFAPPALLLFFSIFLIFAFKDNPLEKLWKLLLITIATSYVVFYGQNFIPKKSLTRQRLNRSFMQQRLVKLTILTAFIIQF
jgi:hypothetical protein